jgi:hypothetical protein
MESDLKYSLQFLKGWIGRYLVQSRPVDLEPAEWMQYIEWHLPEIHHAIDHVIVDHCKDDCLCHNGIRGKGCLDYHAK